MDAHGATCTVPGHSILTTVRDDDWLAAPTLWPSGRLARVPLTIAGLINLPQLQLRLRAGERGAAGVVRWAHAIELADPTAWLRGGELLLTTGMGLPATAQGRAAYVHRLASAGAAGLAFGVGVHFPDIPAAMLTAADACDLPVIDVPLPVPFIAITEAVAAHHAAEQLETTQRLLDAQRLLAAEAARHGPLGLLRALTRHLGGSAVILDASGAVLARAGPHADGLLEAIGEESLRRRRSPRHFSVSLVSASHKVVLQSLGGGQVPSGQLAVSVPGELSASGQVLLGHAASVLSLTVDKPDALLAAERVLQACVLDALLAGLDATSLKPVLRHLALAGAEGSEVTAVVAAAVPGAGTLTDLLDALSGHLERRGVPHLATIRNGTVVLLLRAEHANDGTSGQRQALEEAADALSARSGLDLRLGVSQPVALAGVSSGLHQARLALRSASAAQVTRFEDLSAYAVLLAGQTPQALRALAESVLAPLLTCGEDAEVLTRTLSAFVASTGSLSAAAERLGVHRHTMRNRMQRVEALLGRDVDAPDVRAELWLALTALDLAGNVNADPTD